MVVSTCRMRYWLVVCSGSWISEEKKLGLVGGLLFIWLTIQENKDTLHFYTYGTVLAHLQQEHRRLTFLTWVMNLVRSWGSTAVQPLAVPFAVNFSSCQIKRWWTRWKYSSPMKSLRGFWLNKTETRLRWITSLAFKLFKFNNIKLFSGLEVTQTGISFLLFSFSLRKKGEL